MSQTAWEYYPPSGAVVRFTTGRTAAQRFLAAAGVGPVSVKPVTIKGPAQVGETALDVQVPGRVVPMQFQLRAASTSALWAQRATIERSLALQPITPTSMLRLGRLRLLRDALPALELDALPISSDLPMPRNGVGVLDCDVEWYAPNPFWRETADRQLTFQQAGGFELDDAGFELDLAGFEVLSNNVEQDVVNEGDVDAPILVQMFGEATTVRVINVTTGQTLEVTGDVAEGDYVEISTAFGDKRVELVESDGTRTSIMDRLNLAAADFWRLAPGLNTVRFEADVNVTGYARVSWRQRFSGI